MIILSRRSDQEEWEKTVINLILPRPLKKAVNGPDRLCDLNLKDFLKEKLLFMLTKAHTPRG